MRRDPGNYSRPPRSRTTQPNPNSRRSADYEAYYADEREQSPPRISSRSREDYYEDDYAQRYIRRKPQKSHSWLVFALIVIALTTAAAGAYMLFVGNNSAQIMAVSPHYVTTQQPYQNCHKVGTTTYVQNQKDGTKGALIGGATGALAGGIVGNQIHGGGGGTAVGAIVGGATGALVGRDIQRSNQPDYVAKHGSTTKCGTAYRRVKTQAGYNVQYLYKNNVGHVVVQNQLSVGSKMPYQQLQSMAISAQ
jgi:uncharacterized protein YcfJ